MKSAREVLDQVERILELASNVMNGPTPARRRSSSTTKRRKPRVVVGKVVR